MVIKLTLLQPLSPIRPDCTNYSAIIAVMTGFGILEIWTLEGMEMVGSLLIGYWH